MVQRVRLDREAWSEAALQALAERGVAGVAVEPIAARLGATKGSFYAHFPHRDALIEAAVARWEQQGTEQLINTLGALTDPIARLRELFDHVFRVPTLTRAELALLADADHPLIAPVLARVTARRLNYLTAQFAKIGFTTVQARNRAVLSYTTFIGLLQAERTAGGTVFDATADRDAYLDFLLPRLLDQPADTDEGKDLRRTAPPAPAP